MRAVFWFFLLTGLVVNGPPSEAHGDSTWAMIDGKAARNATTNAHNRKIAEAGSSLFLGYCGADGSCRLARSCDGGKSWKQVALPMLIVNQAPVIVVDSKQRLHLVARMSRREDRLRMRYLRFSQANDWSAPEIDRISVVAGPKYALAYDPMHDILYLSHRESGDLHIAVLNTSGDLLRNELLLKSRGRFRDPDYEDAHYQSLCVDDRGWLHLFYTRTQFPLPKYRYRSVRYLRSRDQAKHWERADNTPIDTPYEIGDSSSDTRISLLEEEETSPVWGTSVAAIGDSVHLLYSVMNVPATVYVRLDRATGRETARQRLPLEGCANALAHSQSAAPQEPPRLFAFGHRGHYPALALSDDGGTTWRIAATFTNLPLRQQHQFYWNTCMLTLTRSGWFCGAVTEIPRRNTHPDGTEETGRVFFVRWK